MDRLVVLIGVLFVLFIGNCAYMGYQIEQAGGLGQMAIEAGKGIKDIAHEIDQHQSE